MPKGTPIPTKQDGVLYVYVDDIKVEDCDFLQGDIFEFIQPDEYDPEMKTVEALIAAGYETITIETWETIDLKKVLEKAKEKQ